MSAWDDELTQRYREASEQDDARPGAHVRGAVRAHAQMLAAAAAPLPASPAPPQAAANQSRWKVSALATVAVLGLTGLLLLQFQRGTPEEQEIAYGQRRAAAPSASVQAPAAAPPAPAAAPQAPQAAPPKPAAPAPEPTRPLARTAPAPALQEAEAPPVPGQVGAVSGFPASPPLPGAPPSGTGTAAAPAATPAPPSAPPRSEMRERLAARDAAAAKSIAPPPPAAAPAAAAEAARSSQPESARPAAQAAAGSGLRRDDAADKRLAAAAPRAHSERSSAALPDGLWEAARTGRTPQVESLIAQGTAIDARDTQGRTALMLAAANGQSATVQKLLALGANPALVDHEGLSAAQQARRLGHNRIAELIDAGS